MTTSHITIPKKPTVEVIEAMIEASLANKNNVEAIYQAVVAHFDALHFIHSRNMTGEQIARLEVGTGERSASRAPFVFVTCYVGAEQKPATGYMTPDKALELSEDFFNMAMKAVGMAL